MNVIRKSETVDIRTEEEMVEYLKTAVKDGFKHVKIEVEKAYDGNKNAFRITIEKP